MPKVMSLSPVSILLPRNIEDSVAFQAIKLAGMASPGGGKSSEVQPYSINALRASQCREAAQVVSECDCQYFSQ